MPQLKIDNASSCFEGLHLCICMVVARWLGVQEIAVQKIADMEK